MGSIWSNSDPTIKTEPERDLSSLQYVYSVSKHKFNWGFNYYVYYTFFWGSYGIGKHFWS